MDANEARTFHMRRLVSAAGGPAEWARRYGGDRWQQPQVSQWISENSPKGIGKNLARDLETAQGLAKGYLDRIPNDALANGSVEPISGLDDIAAHHAFRQVHVRGTVVVDAQGQIPEVAVDANGDGFFVVDSEDRDAYFLRVRGAGSLKLAKPGWYILLAPNSPPQTDDDVVVKLTDGRYLAATYMRREGTEHIVLTPDGRQRLLEDSEVEFIHPVHGTMSPKQLRR